uniref:Uncharacterized protein n=1 Tax=Anguilla anguilla TaxID=7936 RepID=A0A0E9VJJ7_ANGAN
MQALGHILLLFRDL